MQQPILAIETTGTYCSVALVDAGQCFFSQSDRKRSHADELLSTIDHLLNQASVSLADCAAIAVNLGPGSFTGIRIGIAVAQGLAFGADLKTCAVSALQAMVLDASQKEKTVDIEQVVKSAVNQDGRDETVWAVLLHAREDEFYFAEYSLDSRGYPVLVGKESVINGTDIAAWLALSKDKGHHTVFVGEAWDRIEMPGITAVPASVNAKTVAQVARYKFDHNITLDPTDLVPSYLKDEMHYRTVSNDNQPA
ncbi:tRNA (adenosine(37)-N6)-threonylcarbamoyltransferase complex dimerization subunit type 1 TsaB [Pseudohongiella nitratireducens]|uniref:tRNA threonylcarbamoyladenosine biosynthesis protein TsaB n=1 Tax=Pseudohongiella nitratireducens TaxID=1768907 RepID=A0A917LPZ8_9GAMM|nr:tRNA (adenosine(37)-N6)-threonylcarbamoyltransferase complex dimerization subunit type 1 TsaB [Pseudohongiella nitratireducens]GGG49175.1 tRNA (adenosine(37)-N6)-threonylcarbamoyltransferase complex dimerization subunit type 1 TsaB [Pseudohongiella nitratireducens]